MTIANQTNRTSAVGSGSTGQEVPFSFPITATSDLTVIKRITATGVPTDLAETTNYTIVITGDTGGTLTTVTTIETTETIHIIRNTPLTQSLDLEQGGSFNAENIEDALDKNTKLSIENSDALERTLVFPATDPSSSFANMPNSIDRASKNLTFDSDGKPTASVSIEEGSVTHTDFGKTIAEAANADTVRGLIELDTDDDVEFAAITGTTGTFSGAISGTTGTFTDIITKGLWVDVRHPDFGAVGDGVTDNTVAIQAAVDTGKDVFFPTPATAWAVKNSITISIAGQKLFGTGIGCKIKGISGGNINAQATPIFKVTANDVTIQDLAIEDVDTALKAYHINFVKVTGGKVLDCKFTYGYRNLAFKSCRFFKVLGNTFEDTYEVSCSFSQDDADAGGVKYSLGRGIIANNVWDTCGATTSAGAWAANQGGNSYTNNQVYASALPFEFGYGSHANPVYNHRVTNNLFIDCPGPAGIRDCANVVIEGNGFIITDPTTETNRGYVSIKRTDASGSYPDNIKISNNFLIGYGIVCEVSTDDVVTINDNYIRYGGPSSYNSSLRCQGAGSKFIIKDNFVLDVDEDHAISIGPAAFVVLSGNVVEDTAGTGKEGIRIDTVTDIILENNTVRGTTDGWGFNFTTTTSNVSFLGNYSNNNNDGDLTGTANVTWKAVDNNVGAQPLRGSAAYAGGAISDNSFTVQSVTVTGAVLGDFAVVSFSADIDDVQMNAIVTIANTVIVTFYNNTGGAKTPVGTVYVKVIKK